MRVANKVTPEPKSKMAQTMPEHTGREQKKAKKKKLKILEITGPKSFQY
jgi:hypothetical protein